MFLPGGRTALAIAILVGTSTIGRADEPVAPAEPAPVTPAPVVEPAPPAPAPSVVAPTAAVDAKPAPVVENKDVVPRPSFKLCIGLGAGAVAAIVTGAVLGGVAKSRESEQNGDVSSPPLYTPALIDRGKQAETIAIAGYALLGVGGALAIADLVLWIERLRRAPKPKTQAALLRPAATTTTVSVHASGLSVSF